MIFVDSSAWITFFNGGSSEAATRLENALRTEDAVCLADIVLTEVLQGFRADRDFELARRTLSRVDRLPLSHRTYVDAARLSRRLRARGLSVGTIDCLLAQGCITAGAAMLTEDADFEVIARHTRLRLVR